MRRRRWRPEQKALIVLEGLKGRPIGELCAAQILIDRRDEIIDWLIWEAGSARNKAAIECSWSTTARSRPPPIRSA